MKNVSAVRRMTALSASVAGLAVMGIGAAPAVASARPQVAHHTASHQRTNATNPITSFRNLLVIAVPSFRR